MLLATLGVKGGKPEYPPQGSMECGEVFEFWNEERSDRGNNILCLLRIASRM